jgi:hypothetical protein
LLGIYIVSGGTIGVATIDIESGGHVERKAARKAVREPLISCSIRQKSGRGMYNLMEGLYK